jgi:hypothetical protein
MSWCLLLQKLIKERKISSIFDIMRMTDFTSHSRIFHLYGDITIAGEGLQNLGLCSALRVFKQGGIFIVPHLLWHRTLVFPVSSEGSPHSVAFYDTWGVWMIYSNADPHRTTRMMRIRVSPHASHVQLYMYVPLYVRFWHQNKHLNFFSTYVIADIYLNERRRFKGIHADIN